MDVNNILGVVLASGVISTVITVLFNFYKDKRALKINKITEQRVTWRNDMREICDELSTSHDYNVLKANVEKLKCRINPFGMYGGTDGQYKINDFYDDAYVWSVIKEVEKNRYSLLYINKLVIRLSLLLKYDWDRSKNEIIGKDRSYTFLFGFVGYYLCLSLFFLESFHFDFSSENFSYSTVVPPLVVMILLPFLTFLFRDSIIKNVYSVKNILIVMGSSLILFSLSSFYLLNKSDSFFDYELVLVLFLWYFCIFFLWFSSFNRIIFKKNKFEIEEKYLVFLNSLK